MPSISDTRSQVAHLVRATDGNSEGQVQILAGSHVYSYSPSTPTLQIKSTDTLVALQLS